MTRATLPSIGELHEAHPCRFKPIYHGMFVEPIREALIAAGVEVGSPGGEERGVIARITFDDGARARCLIDYADQVHIDGLVPFFAERIFDRARWRHDLNGFDVLFKMKPCDRFASEYDDFTRETGIPVIPWGYLIAPTTGEDPAECVADRKWFFDNLAGLRSLQDACLEMNSGDPKLMTRGAFHQLSACPERRRFFEPELDQGAKEGCTFRRHMQDVASAAALLNLCGPDDTIDRKVVEACAIGVPLVSSPGLKDLRLPRGRRFVHGENVWFIDSTAELRTIFKEGLPIEVRRTLSAGGRSLYADCFDPRAIGTWMLEQARSAIG